MENGSPEKPEETKTRIDTESKVVCTDDWVPSDPVDTPSAFEAYKRRLRAKYGSCFADETEFELFCMLPVDGKQRDVLVASMIQDSQARAVVIPKQQEQ